MTKFFKAIILAVLALQLGHKARGELLAAPQRFAVLSGTVLGGEWRGAGEIDHISLGSKAVGLPSESKLRWSAAWNLVLTAVNGIDSEDASSISSALGQTPPSNSFYASYLIKKARMEKDDKAQEILLFIALNVDKSAPIHEGSKIVIKDAVVADAGGGRIYLRFATLEIDGVKFQAVDPGRRHDE